MVSAKATRKKHTILSKEHLNFQFVVISGDLADLINAIEANDQNEVDKEEIKRFKSDKSKCQDFGQHAAKCPNWTGYCKDDEFGDFMQTFCKKSCGLCPQGPGTVMEFHVRKTFLLQGQKS